MCYFRFRPGVKPGGCHLEVQFFPTPDNVGTLSALLHKLQVMGQLVQALGETLINVSANACHFDCPKIPPQSCFLSRLTTTLTSVVYPSGDGSGLFGPALACPQSASPSTRTRHPSIMTNRSPAPLILTLYVRYIHYFTPWRRGGLTSRNQVPPPFEPCCDFSARRLMQTVDPAPKYIDPPSDFRIRSSLMSSINATVDSLDDDLRTLSLDIHGQYNAKISYPP